MSTQPLATRIGILQGRLVPSTTGELQCSPGARWREEFALAASIGLNHIELVADAVPDPANPIWTTEGRREVLEVAEAAGVGVPSLCVNEPGVRRFDDNSVALDLLSRLEPVVTELRSTIVVLPLHEASDLGSLEWARVARCVGLVANGLRDRGTRVALELGISADDSQRFLDAIPSEVGICYDVGNATAAGFDAPSELALLGSRVWHVHAKDKDASKTNVRFGTGDVPFAAVLCTLGNQGFDGLVTIEATRGEDPVVTAREHRTFLLTMAADQVVVRGADGSPGQGQIG